jgi:hypothetical protein
MLSFPGFVFILISNALCDNSVPASFASVETITNRKHRLMVWRKSKIALKEF